MDDYDEDTDEEEEENLEDIESDSDDVPKYETSDVHINEEVLFEGIEKKIEAVEQWNEVLNNMDSFQKRIEETSKAMELLAKTDISNAFVDPEVLNLAIETRLDNVAKVYQALDNLPNFYRTNQTSGSVSDVVEENEDEIENNIKNMEAASYDIFASQLKENEDSIEESVAQEANNILSTEDLHSKRDHFQTILEDSGAKARSVLNMTALYIIQIFFTVITATDWSEEDTEN